MACSAFLLRGLPVLTSCHWTTSAEIEWRGKGGRNIERRIKKADWINEWNPHQRVNWEEHGEPEPTLPGVQKVSSHPCYILFPLSKLIYHSHGAEAIMFYCGCGILVQIFWRMIVLERAGLPTAVCFRDEEAKLFVLFWQKPYMGLHTH
jgi:hypothetical protein